MRTWIQMALLAVLAVGCTAKKLPNLPAIAATPIQIQAGEVRVPDQVISLTDSSGTMYENKTFPLAKALTQTFVRAMPDASASSRSSRGYEAGLVGFGGDERIRAPLAPFNRRNLSSTASALRPLGEVGGFGGRTPLGAVLAESRVELAGKSGVAALVIFSDGLPSDEMTALRAGKALADSRSGQVCIHTVQTGDDPAGASFLDRLSRLTSCGSHRTAASVGTPSAFAQFARDVFVGRAPAAVVDACSGVIRLRGVEFEFDSDRLVGASAVVLDVAADSLRGCANISVRVEGHTDSVGSEAYNQDLGLRRARAVRSHLVSRGVSAGRLTTGSFGESRPLASNDTDEGRALNRRVELHTQ
jgi:OOP family OmpA-OmpF porin